MLYLSIFLYCVCFVFVSVCANGGNVVFRDRNKSNQGSRTPTQTFHTGRSIPLDMIMKMNSITDEEDFINQFIEPDPLESLAPSTARRSSSLPQSGGVKRVSRLTDSRHLARDTEIEAPQISMAYSLSGASFGGNSRLVDGVGITTRFGGNTEQVENSNDKKNETPSAKPATCQPELRTVSLKDEEDSTIIYFPSCTRVERCGGCCSHDLLSCQAMSVEYKNFSVIVAQYNGGHKLESRGRKIVTVLTHTKCKCDCKIKAKDCSAVQEYKKNECRCVCTNKDEQTKCAKDRIRLWNPTSCSCQCRDVQECSTGLTFDQATCSCIASSLQFPPTYNIQRNEYKIGYPEQ